MIYLSTMRRIPTVSFLSLAFLLATSSTRPSHAYTPQEYVSEVRIMTSDIINSTYVEAGGDDNNPLVTFAEGDASSSKFIEEHNIVSGDQVMYMTNPEGQYIDGTFMKVASPPLQLNEILNGSIINITATVYIVNFCNWTNPVFKSNITTLMFNRNTSQEDNIERYYDVCTYGKVKYVSDNIAVFDNIRVDCWGNITSGSLVYKYNSSNNCSANEQFAWRMAGENLAKQAALTDPKIARILNSTNRRIITILPNKVTCAWAGLGSVGCGGRTCQTYIKGTAGFDNSVVFHELGHNIGLSHAGKDLNEYGDQTDPMGDSGNPYIKKILCFNAGNMYRVGIAAAIPAGNLTSADFTLEKNHKTFTIPATSFKENNYVVIDLAQYNKTRKMAYPKYFISYRVRRTTYGGYDAGLPTKYDRKVFIISFNGTQDTRDFNRTLFRDYGPSFAKSNSTWWSGPFINITGTDYNYGGGLRVNVLSTGDMSATVDICKMYSQKEVCFMNLDLDCDGLYGLQDPDCIGVA